MIEKNIHTVENKFGFDAVSQNDDLNLISTLKNEVNNSLKCDTAQDKIDILLLLGIRDADQVNAEKISNLSPEEFSKICMWSSKLTPAKYSISTFEKSLGLLNYTDQELNNAYKWYLGFKKQGIDFDPGLIESISSMPDFGFELIDEFGKDFKELNIRFGVKELIKFVESNRKSIIKCLENLKSLKEYGLVLYCDEVSFFAQLKHEYIRELGLSIKKMIDEGVKKTSLSLSYLSRLSIEQLRLYTYTMIQLGKYGISNMFFKIDDKYSLQDLKKIFEGNAIKKLVLFGVKINSKDFYEIASMSLEQEKVIDKLSIDDISSFSMFMKNLEMSGNCPKIAKEYRKSKGITKYKSVGKKYYLGDSLESKIQLQKVQNFVNDTLDKYPEIVGCTIFGSYTKGYADVDISDIDTTIFVEDHPDLSNSFSLRDYEKTFLNKHEYLKLELENKLDKIDVSYIVPISNEIIDFVLYSIKNGNVHLCSYISKMFSLKVGGGTLGLYRNHFKQRIETMSGGKEVYNMILNDSKYYDFFNTRIPIIKSFSC